MKYSFIIPVYNRPEEVDELLASLMMQGSLGYEVIIVEDGSDRTCESVVNTYIEQLSIRYYKIPNAGPGGARNYGAENAAGDWFIFLDSDTLIPPGYLEAVNEYLKSNDIDAFGGADRDQEDFKPIQKAISYSMTSFLTTGGIRGSERSMEKFKPRSFNMGIRRTVFQELGGFGTMRYGEDIDFSLRIERSGWKTAFIPRAFVYHKRRTSFRAFFKQIQHSGEARIMLTRLHKGSLKLVHFLPVLFALGLVVTLGVIGFLPLIGMMGLILYLIYFFILFVHATLKLGNIRTSILAVVASFIQLFAYGTGFIIAAISKPLKS